MIIDDSNYKILLGDGTNYEFGGEKFALAAKPRVEPVGALSYAAPFSSAFPLIPRSEWDARIDELARLRATPADYALFPAYDQSRTNYCWANGPCQAASNVLWMQGTPHKKLLSSASIAGPITGYRNVGGWGEPAIKYLIENGACSMETWPNAAISRQYDTPESREERKHLMVMEAFDGDGFDELATALLHGFPCPAAYNWWGHLVYIAEIVRIERGSYGVRLRNSWTEQWGDKHPRTGFGGYQVIREGRGTPSSWQAIRAVKSSGALK